MKVGFEIFSLKKGRELVTHLVVCDSLTSAFKSILRAVKDIPKIKNVYVLLITK